MSIQELLDQEFATIPALIRAHAELRPRRAALIQDDRQLDFAALDACMDRVGVALQRDAVRPGDVIAICAATSIEYTTVLLGALRVGVVVAPLAPSSTAESLAAMLADCGAKLLFLDRSVAAALEPVRAQLRAQRIALDIDAPGASPGPATPTTGDVPFESWLAPANQRPQPVTLTPDAPFNVIYSSGTTGTPKGIVQPHRMRWAHVRRGGDSGYGTDSITLVSTPLYSNTTLVSFFPAIALGGTVVLMAKFDAAKFLAIAEQRRVTHAMLVPVQYQRIMDLPEFDRFDLSSFRMKFCTSAPFSAALKQRVLTRFPGGLVEYFGMTEGGGTCVLHAHKFPDKLHTVGRPLPGHEVRLIDEQGREVGPGEAGEVVGCSPAAMMLGYHNQPGMTSDAEWYDSTGKRFIRSGDIGLFDSDGFLVLLDRKKDMIISGGFNVYPSDLERVLLQHPAVAEAAVIGVPSARWGETPIGFVVCKAGQVTTAEEISRFVNERVGKTQRLTAVERLDALPRSPIGKVLKRQLRDQYTARTAVT